MGNNNYEELKYVLIEKVRSFPAIWDKNHEQHHNRYVLHQHWKKIAFEAGMREDRIKKIWRNLRQEFGKQVKRIYSAGCESLETACPQWPYFQGLLFLKEQFITGETTSSNPTEPDAEPNQEDNTFDEFQEEFEGTSPYRSRSPSVISDNTPQHQNGLVPYAGYNNNSNNGGGGSRKRKHSDTEDMTRVMFQLEKEKMEMQRQQQNTANARDEDLGFFNSLLPHVRQLPPQQKMVFRLRVQQQLYELMYGPYDPHQRLPYTAASNHGEAMCTAVYNNDH